MPTPSNSINVLSALTGEAQEDDNVNQFGINPAHAANMPISMTPVTEKEPPQYTMKNEDSADKTAASTKDSATPASTIRPHQNSILAQKKTQPSPSSSSALSNGPTHHHHQSTNSTISKTTTPNHSLSNPTSTSTSSVPFPTIPTLKGDFFIDSTTNKSKLVSELDSIIKLFNQGLDALETHL